MPGPGCDKCSGKNYFHFQESSYIIRSSDLDVMQFGYIQFSKLF